MRLWPHNLLFQFFKALSTERRSVYRSTPPTATSGNAATLWPIGQNRSRVHSIGLSHSRQLRACDRLFR
jgi:hypothetical protein